LSAPLASRDEIVGYLRNRLRAGSDQSELVDQLMQAGWSRELAGHLVDQVWTSLLPQRQERAQRAALNGALLLAAGLAIVGLTRAAAAEWPTHGPLLIIWATVAGGAANLAGGLLSLRMLRRASTEDRVSIAEPLRVEATHLADYAQLGLAPGSSLEELRHAYRELMKRWHPDRLTGWQELHPAAARRVQAINESYGRLLQALETGRGKPS
jgi:hypothetical protein